jgi:hypothetical protein
VQITEQKTIYLGVAMVVHLQFGSPERSKLGNPQWLHEVDPESTHSKL